MNRLILVLIAATAFFLESNGQSAEIRTREYNLTSSKLAISGYDPVAYFTQNKAIKGSKDHALYHQGVLYYFSSDMNKEQFKKSPSSYEPQYGGWCAYAMGNDGTKVEIDPETFKIIDGKLYLFYNKYFNNTLKSWNKNQAALKQSADKNWKKFVP